jgi:transposase
VVKVAKQEGRRMPDELTRALGLVGLRVTGVRARDGDALEVEVEGLERAERCPHCDATQLEIKERPIVGVQDLPLAGRRTRLCWRKRRYRCRSCRRTHTERHPGLPSRQRVSARLRARLAARAAVGGAHAEIAREEGTSRYQVTRALALVALAPATGLRRISFDEAHHRRGRELATVVSDLDRRRVVEVLDGRSQKVVARYLRGLGEEALKAIEVVSIDPYEAYRQAIWEERPGARIVCDRFHLVRGANTALDAVRRERQRVEARKRPKGTRRSGKGASWRPELYRARRVLLKARERLSERERRRLCEPLCHGPGDRRGLGAQGGLSRPGERSGRGRAAACRLPRRGRAGGASVLRRLRGRHPRMARGASGLLRRANHQRIRRGVINKVKVIKRRAYGLPSFESFRHRVLVACG